MQLYAFVGVLAGVKKKLIRKLKIRFLFHEMFLGLSILTISCSPSSSQIVKSFPKHVEVIKNNLLL
jgi:hypothetical protein